MATTLVGDVSNQIQKYWAPKFTKELRESLLLGGLVSKDYQGEIKRGGDTVYVSQINAPAGELRTVGTDADVFSSEKVSMTRISVQANKRAVASFEFEDLAVLQSQLDQQDSEIKNSLLFAMNKQINNYLYSLVAPSSSAPDHIINSIATFGKSTAQQARLLAGAAKWDQMKPWYMLLDPTYYTDALADTTLASSDFGAQDRPIIAGQMALPRFGFNILEDNSAGLLSSVSGTAKAGLAFHPDFMHMVSQSEVNVKVSDLHSNHQFGYVISVDLIFGAALGVAGNVKHISIKSN